MLTPINREYKDHKGRTINGGMPIANQGDKGTYTVDFMLDFSVYLSYDVNLIMTAGSPVLTLSGIEGGWAALGITAGDTIDLTNLVDAGGGITFTGSPTVSSIDGNDLTAGIAYPSNALFISGKISVTKSPEGVIAKFNLTGNDFDTENSIIDGTVNTFINKDITSLTPGGTALNLIQSTDKSGGIFDSVQISRLSDVGTLKVYRLTFNFTWWGYLSDFEENFLNEACITPLIDVAFLPLWNNPNVRVQVKYKPQGDGNSGYKNENFNINPNHFKVKSVVWEDVNGQPLNSFDLARESILKVTVENLSGGGFGNTVGLLVFNDLDDEDLYKNTENIDHAEHTLLFNKDVSSSIASNDSATGEDGAKYNVETSWSVTGQELIFEAKFNPNQDFIDRFTNEDHIEKLFCFWLRVESSSFQANNYSDTTNVEVWAGEGEENPIYLGIIDGATIFVLDHFKEAKSEIITEDDVRVEISANPLNKNGDGGKILGVKWEAEIYNFNTFERHRLWSDEIEAPDNYDGSGFLIWNEIKEMYWKDYFPETAINNYFSIESSSSILNISAPFLIDWRYFRTIPSLSQIFGDDAVKNWIYYQNLGWGVELNVSILTENGAYKSGSSINIRDYDDNVGIDWVWQFFRLSDNAPLTSPINEPMRVIAIANDNIVGNPPYYATLTVEPFENDYRYLISSKYDQINEVNSPLQPLPGQTRLVITTSSNAYSLACDFYPDKLDTSVGVKFTARLYEGNHISVERTVIDFPVAKLPAPDLEQDFEDFCGECCTELKLASLNHSDIARNDITGVIHKLQTSSDSVTFTIKKDGVTLPNNGVDYSGGLPNDTLAIGFIFNWRYYLINYGEGAYTIEKDYTIAGLPFNEKIGEYNLCIYDKDSAEKTVKVQYQCDFETLFNYELINFADSGFEDSYRFRGFFGEWQPNLESNANFSVINENRVNSVKSKDTYILRHFGAIQCHLERLHKIALSATIWCVSWQNRNNTLQRLEVIECVLDNSNKELINYNVGARKTDVEIILSKRQQNSVSLFSGSVATIKGATHLLPDVSGTVGYYNVTFNGGFSTVINNNTNFTIVDICGNSVGVASVVNGLITIVGCVEDDYGFDYGFDFGLD